MDLVASVLRGDRRGAGRIAVEVRYRELFDNAIQLTEIARSMHITGMPVDMDVREAHRVRLTKERDDAEEKFRAHTKFAGELSTQEKLLGSNKQLQLLFFTHYGVIPTEFSDTSGEPVLDKGVLRDLLGHPNSEVRRAAELLLAYRQAATTESRYIGRGYYPEPEAYGLHVLRSTGRHHPTFGVCAAETLRFTCQGGAQQIQKDQYAEIKQADGSLKVQVVRQGARDIFVAPPGWLWLETDYSALELRLFALYGAIELWLEEFRKPHADVHKINAAFMLKKLFADIKKQDRDVCKTATFGGIVYGGASKTVWSQVVNKYPRMTVAIIDEFKANIEKAIPRIPMYQKEAIEEANRLGYTPLATGDRIWWKFAGMVDKYGKDTMYGEPKSTDILNKRMQKTGARIINDAMPRVHARLDPARCKLVLQLHDALHALVREDSVKESALVFKQEMEQELSWTDKYGTRTVFLSVEQKLGSSWGKLDDYKEAA